MRELSLFMVYYALEGEYLTSVFNARRWTNPLYGKLKTLKEKEAPANDIINIMQEISWINSRCGVYRALHRQQRIIKTLKKEACL